MENPISDNAQDTGLPDSRAEINLPDAPEINLPKPGTEIELPPGVKPIPDMGSGNIGSGAPGPMPVLPAAPTNAWAIVSLISGIASWIGLFGVGGIVAVIAGLVARRNIRDSHGAEGGDNLALAGIIIGGLNIAFACIGLLCVLGLFGAGMAGALTDFGNSR